MPLTSTLGTPSALYRKLDREAYRAFHAKSKLHKADHFFNFCVTAHSMRDFCLEHQQKFTQADKQPFHDLWNQQPFLVATREIANSSKHFVLRSRKTGGVTSPSTKAVRMGSAKYITVYRQNNALLYGEPYTRSEVRVELSDGRVLPLYEFTGEVLKYWRVYLASLGIKVRRVSLRSHGAA
jgi:hypothetical protein